MSHELIPAKRLRYPGGKNGTYQAGCTCGYRSGVYAYPGQAEKPALEHIKAKLAPRSDRDTSG